MFTTHPPLPPNAALRWDLVRCHLERVAPASVLELGAGQGAFGCRLAEHAVYVGVEPDETSRATALSRLGDRGRLVVDLDALPEGDTFDMVCAFEVLEHIEDDHAALATWVSRVRPGGHVLVSVPAEPDRFGAWDELVGHVRRYSADDLRGLLAAAALEVVSVDHYGFLLSDASEQGRNLVARRRLRQGDAASDAASRTAGSGRQLQPPPWAGTVIWWATAPFRTLQRRFSDRGPGLVALARRPV